MNEVWIFVNEFLGLIIYWCSAVLTLTSVLWIVSVISWVMTKTFFRILSIINGIAQNLKKRGNKFESPTLVWQKASFMLWIAWNGIPQFVVGENFVFWKRRMNTPVVESWMTNLVANYFLHCITFDRSGNGSLMLWSKTD